MPADSTIDNSDITRSRFSRLLGLVLCCASVAHVAIAGTALDPDAQTQFEERVYIVQMAEPAALNYAGRPGGIAATRPRLGERFDSRSGNVRAYSRELMDAHDAALQSVGAYDGKLYSYRYTFNGFAARLTPVQAQKLRSRKNVLNVWEDSVRYLYTNDSPIFLGLFDAGAGLITGQELKGEDVVIGVIDSGIAPEHPSFTDTREADMPRLCRSDWAESSLLGIWLCRRFKNRDAVSTFDPPAGWTGQCESGDQFTADLCNNKIIGARYYIDGFLERYRLDENEFMSPRDADGHGTHIASTAAGNEVRASLAGTDIDRVVGMAPRARIAVYKACWLEPGQIRGSCATSDLQRAIEDAVADGVDIINYSVGNTDISISDPDDLALLAASDAGVLSVVAAGNDGPSAGTILSPSGAPWVLTVGASSRIGDKFEEAIRINSPSNVADDYPSREASFTPALVDEGPITAELVLADDGDSSGGTTYDACQSIVNANDLDGQVALLQRGGCDFQDKVANVEAAGAIAAVVFNNQSDLIIMSGTRGSVTIPAVMIGQADGQLLLTELQNENENVVEVTLDKTLFLTQTDDGNVMGSFSSRGPNLTAPDILKPDVTAPGVNILAGQTPDVANGVRNENFQYLTGTSMSVPHVAGVAALIREAHPDWSPAAIKSALMTTSRQNVTKSDRTTPADPFDFGAGHIAPNNAIDPGLVFEAVKEDYDAFTCGTKEPRVTEEQCQQLADAGFPTSALDLNVPSISVSSLVAEQTVRRRVTNVGPAGQYTAQVSAPPGIDVDVTPSVLSLGTGEVGTFDVTLSTSSADLYEWQFGSLSWNDPTHVVHTPIAVRPVPFLAPVESIASGRSGSLQFDVQFGYTGTYEADVAGLAAPFILENITVADDPTNGYVFDPDAENLPASVWRSNPALVVAEDDLYLRVALFNDNTAGDDDLDLYVYYCPGLVFCSLVGVSGEDDSDEQVDVLFPLAGEYIIDVHGFDTEAASTTFDLFIWTVGPGDNLGNLSVSTPSEAISGETGTISVSWDGLERQTHLGAITHGDGEETLEVTVIEIQN
ncbi:MAG: S8 family serine peptidase [Gammaproteobacteria bacterium]|nr:S8 family serine peptidase [Gammaproteobacteria bacterium]